MKRKFIFILLIITVLLTACSSNSSKITSREQRKVDKYIGNYNKDKELLFGKNEKGTKEITIIIKEGTIITDSYDTKKSIKNISKHFVEKIGDDFTISLVPEDDESYIVYSVVNNKVLEDNMEEYIGESSDGISSKNDLNEKVGLAKQEENIINDFLKEYNSEKNTLSRGELDKENRTFIIKFKSTYVMASLDKFRDFARNTSKTFEDNLVKNMKLIIYYEDDIENPLLIIKKQIILEDNLEDYVDKHPERVGR